ncbi:MAG: DNA polymerase I [Cyclobacteriaceae bacterium]|nr:DNA polymerase I [Cyclobacteriaceae bacterium]
MSKETDKKLFLLDAMALIYRAHFAFSKNPRVNSKGMNTGAVYGFTNSLLEILQKEKPSHIGVAFDPKGKTFRHEQFPEYKAQRQEQPEDIQQAIPYVKRMVAAFGIPILEVEGYEADDVIGTIAKQAARDSFTVYMMTPDKDYSQLVEEKIFLYKPAYMGNSVDILGVEEVLKKFDIDDVDQVRDILGLEGDASDNIPGIPGIGKKTAIKLLKEFGSVEKLVESTDQLKGKQKENVEKFAEQGILSKKLATIIQDVPIDYEPDQLKLTDPLEDELKELLQELEFKTIARRVLGESLQELSSTSTSGQMDLFETVASEGVDEAVEEVFEIQNINTTPHQYHLVSSQEELKTLIDYLLKVDAFAFDTETTSLDPEEAELVGLSFCYQKGVAYYLPFGDDNFSDSEKIKLLAPIFLNDKLILIGQNIKYDIMMLRKYDIRVSAQLFDTMIAHYLIEPEQRHNMNFLAEHYLHYETVSIESLIGKKGKQQGNMRDVPLNEIKEYAAEDADITWQLYLILSQELKRHDMEELFYAIEMPLIPVLVAMEFEGVNIDVEALKVLSKELESAIIELQDKIHESAGTTFNIASPKQLGEVLFEKLKLEDKPKKTKSGQYATGEEILSKLAVKHDIAAQILEFRELQKLKSTYVDALPELLSKRDGRIHTSYNQAVTATGRLSSTNPNLQNIPIRTEKGRLIRKAFVPKSENFEIMAADYSQIELRIMADFSGDESMIGAFREGRDIHSTTAAKIFKVALEEVNSDMRRKAKTANFGIIYGISAFGLSQRLDIPRAEATEIIESYFREFPAVKKYMDEIINTARENGYVSTIMGRKRFLADINSRNATMRGYAERNAINAPIQGSAADIIKKAMVDVYQWMKKENLQSRMIMQVHDELVFEVHKDEKEMVEKAVIEKMEEAVKMQIPLDVEAGFGSDWLQAH